MIMAKSNIQKLIEYQKELEKERVKKNKKEQVQIVKT